MIMVSEKRQGFSFVNKNLNCHNHKMSLEARQDEDCVEWRRRPKSAIGIEWWSRLLEKSGWKSLEPVIRDR